MSGVATLKVRGAKRHFDEMAVDLPVQPQACSPSRIALRPPPQKRGRSANVALNSTLSATLNTTLNTTSASISTPASTSSSAPVSVSVAPAAAASNAPSSSRALVKHAALTAPPAPKSEACAVSREELVALSRHLPRRLKRVVDRLAAGQVPAAERLFTLTDLREIVTSLLAEHEAKLNDHFTVTLSERLAEQFRDFTKFNEDYVSRQLRGTDVAYLS